MGEPIIIRLAERTWYDLTNGIHYHQGTNGQTLWVNKQMLDHNSNTVVHSAEAVIARLEWLADVEEARFARVLDNKAQAAASAGYLAQDQAAMKRGTPRGDAKGG